MMQGSITKSLVIIAGGPSLTKDDVDFVYQQSQKNKAEILAVNDAYRLCSEAHGLYACDTSWWDHHYNIISKKYTGKPFTQCMFTRCAKSAAKYHLNYIPSKKGGGLTEDGVIFQGGNGGHQAINLAYLFGWRKILLLGFDCKPNDDGKLHWFGNHPGKLNKYPPFAMWHKEFKNLAADATRLRVEIINCSRDTALECFTRKTIEDCFK